MGKLETDPAWALSCALYLVGAQAGYLRTLLAADVVDDAHFANGLDTLTQDLARVVRLYGELRGVWDEHTGEPLSPPAGN